MSGYKYGEPWELDARPYDTEGRPPPPPGHVVTGLLGGALLKMGKQGSLTFTDIPEDIVIALVRATACTNFCASEEVPDKVGGLALMREALEAIKIRLHFVDMPSEPFWMDGDNKVADWRKEIRLLEAALLPFYQKGDK